jgi:NADPH:quinone reductase-like Zn-dependent oxidoreductase
MDGNLRCSLAHESLDDRVHRRDDTPGRIRNHRMKAIRLHARGGPEVILFEEAPQPSPHKGEVLVLVHASGVTPTELLWKPTWKTMTGEDRKLPIPGHEFSGAIVALGTGVTDLEVGDEIYGMNDWFGNGAHAEFCLARPNEIAPKPRSIDHVQASVTPISALTAWQALFDRGDLAKDQRVLIHGGAGAVGLFAVQLAHWKGAHVITTVSKRNIDFVRELGANETIDYHATQFDKVVKDVDLVLDTVGGDTFTRSWNVIRPGGRVITIAASSEHTDDPRVREAFFIVEARADQLTEIARLIDAGAIRPVVDQIFPLAQAREAYEKKPNRGKVALAVSG